MEKPELGLQKIRITSVKEIKTGVGAKGPWTLKSLSDTTGRSYTYFDGPATQGWQEGVEITAEVSEDIYTSKEGKVYNSLRIKPPSAQGQLDVHTKQILWLKEQLLKLQQKVELLESN